MNNFLIKDAFKSSWNILVKNFLVIIGLTSVISLISWILEIWWRSIDKYYKNGMTQSLLVFLCLYVVTMILSMLVSIGYTKILLKLHDGEDINPKDLFSYWDRLWNFIVVSFLYSLVILIGIVLFIIPGIVWLIKYTYSSYYVIDQNMKPLDAMKASAEITKGNKWKLALFGLCIISINLIGGVFFGVGVLISIPLTVLASIHIFRVLNKTLLFEEGNQPQLPL